jgi:hypothetical protein
MRRGVALTLTVTVLLGVASCAAKPGKLIIGRWEAEGGSTFEFRADGTAVSTTERGTSEYRYRFVDERVFELSRPDGSGGVTPVKIDSIGKDEMVLSRAKSGSERFRRAK